MPEMPTWSGNFTDKADLARGVPPTLFVNHGCCRAFFATCFQILCEKKKEGGQDSEVGDGGEV